MQEIMQKIFKPLKMNMEELFQELEIDKKETVDATTLQSMRTGLEEEHKTKLEELK